MILFDLTFNSLKPVLLVLAVAVSAVAGVPGTRAESVESRISSNLGTIKGVVRDAGGNPISDATVAIFRVGTAKLLKQVRSSSDGHFLAKILPGTYTVLAVAQGFNAVTLAEVEVNRADELVYGFKLERAGSGNTMPEKRADRNSSKWRIRAAQMQRSIYQNREGDSPVDEETTADIESQAAEDEETSGDRPARAVVETYFASGKSGSYSGLNFATVLPVGDETRLVVAGQTSTGNGPQRFEANLSFSASADHKVSMSAAYARLGAFGAGDEVRSLGQVSFQALDQWSVREGVILVMGLDYSRFVGAGNDFSLSPRLGLQFDIDAKTRFRTAYTTQTEEKTWAQAIELEDTQVLFREPASMEDIFVENGTAQMNKTRRFEFGIERVLDNSSSIEANAFFDTTLGRGIGLMSVPIEGLGGEGLGDFVANQQGSAQGLRVVYSRRLNGVFSTSGGYAFGRGQKFSDEPLTTPSNLFEDDFFHTFFGQLQADLKTGTSVKTIFRLSPQATVFAIDPFHGRLAIYDPSLSVFVTQSLPTLGLPFQAQATVDARNLFDFQTGIDGSDGSLRLNSRGRMVRGGIRVRF